MRYNSGQKAQQALLELTNNGTQAERLNAAWSHLNMAGSDDYAQDCELIKTAFAQGKLALENKNYTKLAEAIRDMIEAIFTEDGANETRKILL